MKKRTRTILFFSLFFIFILSTPAIILYSQGYRLDLEKRKITQTGGIFLHIEPKQAEIYINDKLAKKTDFFFGSALLENLLPGGYKIKIKKEGYYLWEKNLEVKEKQVTEAKNITLIQRRVGFTILTKNIKNFWPSLDGKKLVLLENDKNGATLKLYDLQKNLKSILTEEEKKIYPTSTAADSTSTDIISPDKKKSAVFSDSEIWIFYLKDMAEQPAKKAGEKQFLSRLSEKIDDVFWLDNNYLIFNSGNNIKIAETDDRDRIQIWDIGSFPSPKIFFNQADKKLYILSENTLYQSENLIK